MKKLLISAAALILVAVLTASVAFAANANDDINISIDGKVDNREWFEKSEQKSFTFANTNSQLPSNIAFSLYHCFDNKNNMAYFAFGFTVPDNANPYGVILSLSFDSVSKFDLSVSSPTFSNPYDSVASCNAILTNQGKTFSCEVGINYKNGLPTNIGGTASLSIQSQDDESNYFHSNDLNFSYSNYKTDSNTQNQSQNQKTTKSSGGRSNDTTRDSINVYDYITSARTTTRRQTTKKETTTEKTTKETTTTAKNKSTTKKKKSTAKRSTTRKVETSIVYVIPDTVTATVAQNEDTSPASVTATESVSAQDSAFQLEKPSSGTLMKIITAVSAAVLFGVIGIVAVRSRGDDEKEEKTNESDNKEE